MRAIDIRDLDIPEQDAGYDELADFADRIAELVTDAIEVAPVRYGRWEERFVKEGSPFFWRRFYCSACGDWTTHGKSAFCPNCGAKMIED